MFASLFFDQIPDSKPVKRKPFSDDYQFWVWVRPDPNQTADDIRQQYQPMREAGITHVAAQVYDSNGALFGSKRLPVKGEWVERALPVFAELGMSLHAWMWSMPNNIAAIHEKHPDWFVVNRKGQSALTHPAYVPYYKFMCPSHPGVREFVAGNVRELSQISELKGVHLDYIRFPDVILPEALQPNYNIVQDQEYPEYDYCYCERCRADFKAESGLDPMEIKDPANHQDWINFRHQRIIRLVNRHLAPVAREYDKQITAAVFPNWENVRQEWRQWDLDAFLPMLYHNFYNADESWVREHCRKGVEGIHQDARLYAGLFVSPIPAKELEKFIRAGIEGGAKGASFFAANDLSEAHLLALKETIAGL